MKTDHIKNGLRLILFLSLGVLILYFVYREQSVQYFNYCIEQGNPASSCHLPDKIWADLKGAKTGWLLLTIVCYMISNISRTYRWRLLVAGEFGETKFSNVFLAIMVGYFTNLAVPRLGEFVKAGTLGKYEKINMASILGTVVTERLLDVLSLLIIFGLGMILASGQIIEYLGSHARLPDISFSMITGLVLAALLLLGLVFFLLFRYRHHSLILSIKNKIGYFLRGVLSIRHVKNMPALVFHSISIWFMYYLMTYFPFFSFEATSGLGPVAALLVFIFGGLGMVLPAPGGIGTFHAMVIAGLSIYGIAGPDAFSFAMIIFLLINIGVNLVMGVLAFILLPFVNKNYHPVRIQDHGNSK